MNTPIRHALLALLVAASLAPPSDVRASDNRENKEAGTPVPANPRPSADSRFVFVSSTLGDDQNAGLSAHEPKQSLDAAATLLRGGHADWLLLRRGDRFSANQGSLPEHGRSSTEPIVITSYGDSEAPEPILHGINNPLSERYKYVRFIRVDTGSPDPAANQQNDHRIDRRPIVCMFLRNGNPLDPEGLGRIKWWAQPAPKAVASLETYIRQFADIGARRFVLKLPAGTAPNQRMAPLQTQFMSPERRQLLSEMIASLHNDYHDIQVGIYAGFGVDTNPATLKFEGERRIPDFENEVDRQLILNQYRDAIDIVGIDFLVLDALSGWGGDGHALEWTKFLSNSLGVEVIGEAFPMKLKLTHRESAPRTPIEIQRNTGKWMALSTFLPIQNMDAPANAQHYVGLAGNRQGWRSGSDEHRRQVIDQWMSRGYIPYIYAGDSTRFRDAVSYAVERSIKITDDPECTRAKNP